MLSSRHAIGIHGYVLVYSVTSRPSLEMVKIIREKLLNHTVLHPPSLGYNVTSLQGQGTEWIPISLVGNKSDLHMQRTISREEGMAIAREWDCAWTEASARHNENVNKGFELCLEQIEKGNTPPAEEKKGCVIT